MPHKPAICAYCHQPMAMGRVHPSQTTYHGACRLGWLRLRWPHASQAERVWLKREADCLAGWLAGAEGD